KRQKPNAGDAEILEIIQSLNQSWEVADSIGVAVFKCTHMQLIDDSVLEPQRIRSATVPFCHISCPCPSRSAAEFRLQNDNCKRRKRYSQRKRPPVSRERNWRQTAEVSLAAAAI